MAERDFQSKLIKELKVMFEGCIILKNDSSYLQGVPDLLILYKDKWAMLEVKDTWYARRRPNQDYYIDLLDSMSFAAFICPENKEDILNDLQQSFGIRG
jgi:hypothetical protein